MQLASGFVDSLTDQAVLTDRTLSEMGAPFWLISLRAPDRSLGAHRAGTLYSLPRHPYLAARSPGRRGASQKTRLYCHPLEALHGPGRDSEQHEGSAGYRSLVREKPAA